MNSEPINENNAMWRSYHAQKRESATNAARKAASRISSLHNRVKLIAEWHTEWHVTLSHPTTGASVEFYPTRGTIVRERVRQDRLGLDAALKLIGVRE